MKKFALAIAAAAIATSFSSAAFADVGAVFVGKKGNENVVTKIKHLDNPNKIRIFMRNEVKGKVRKFTIIYNDQTGEIKRNSGRGSEMKAFLADLVQPIIDAEVEAYEADQRSRNANRGVTYVVNSHGEHQAVATGAPGSELRSTLLSRSMAVVNGTN